MKLLLAFAAAALFAVPAKAQLADGYSGYSSAPRSGVEAQYWSLLDQVGPCLANQKEDQSIAFVESVIGSDEEAEAFDTLFNVGRNRRNNCLGRYSGLYGAQRAHLRGSVAEGLAMNLSDAQWEALASSPPPAPAAIGSLHDFAYCYATAHPLEVRELLRRTDIRTEGELEFIQAIAADFGACLPQDREVTLEATSIRMALAEAVFRAATGRPAATIQEVN